MGLNPTKSRTSELKSLGRRTATAVDAAAPSVDAGHDVTEWDQVLLVVSGTPVGVAEILVYAQYRGFIGASEGPAMVPMTYLRAVPVLDHTSTYRGGAVFILNTMKADVIYPAIVSMTGATSVYLNVLGLTPKGAPLLSGSGVAGEDDSDVFDVVDIVKVGGQTLAAHGAAATTVPVIVGARANAADPADVDESDAVLLSTTLGSRLRTQNAGVAAHGSAVSGNPVLTGAKATGAEPAAVDEGDVADLSVDLGSRLRTTATGNVADGSAAALNPVRVAGTADAALSTVDDGDVAQLVTDLYRRLVTLPHGATADDAADTAALNPVKVGGVAVSHLAPDAADAGDVVHLSTDLYRRLRTLAEGPVADDAAADASNPVKTGAVAVADAAAATPVTTLDLVHLTADLYRRLRVAAEGAAAHDAAVNGFPVIVGAKATAAEPATVTEGDASYLSVDLLGRLRVDVMGNVAHDSADSGRPVKIGLRAEATTITAVADGDRVDAVGDLYGRQVVRDGIAGDDIASANRVSSNTHADDRDESAQVWGSVTDDATDPDYFPSSSGYEVGNRTWLVLHLRIRDGVVTFECSNDGSNWEDCTQVVVDRNTGAGGYASFSEADSATVDFLLETTVGARYIRCKWDPNNATSVFSLYVMSRVP